jgi:transposase-like protein
MRKLEFHQLIESLSTLSPHQLRKLNDSVGKLAKQNEVRELVAEQVQQTGNCPHCASSVFTRRGTTDAGEQRYHCKDCSKSFTGLTGTPVGRLHHKDRLLDYAACMKDGLSIREAAAKLELTRTLVFRWRHRLMPRISKHQPQALPGVAEVDETFFRKSFKGQRKDLPRKAYSRGTRAGKRGLSDEQVPVLTAISRGSPPLKGSQRRTCRATWRGSGSSTEARWVRVPENSCKTQLRRGQRP